MTVAGQLSEYLGVSQDTISVDIQNSQLGKMYETLGESWNDKGVAEVANRLGLPLCTTAATQARRCRDVAVTLPVAGHPTPCAMRFGSLPAGARAAWHHRFTGGAGGMIWPLSRLTRFRVNLLNTEKRCANSSKRARGVPIGLYENMVV